MTETTEITERKVGATVSLKITRGTGTRDQDTMSVKCHVEDLGEAGETMSYCREILAKEANRVRAIQPDADTVPESDDG